MGRLFLTLLYTSLVVAILIAGVFAWGFAKFTGPGPLTVPRVSVIPAGSGLERIANTLLVDDVIQHPEIFAIGVKLLGQGRALKAGEYLFPVGISPRDAMTILIRGETVVRRLTFAEGLTVSRVMEKLMTSEGLFGVITNPPGEGSLLPETYHFSYGDDRVRLLARMADGMSELLAELWPTRAPDLPYATVEEAVILASVVERETAVGDERGVVAGVFVNRLRLGMRLQSDPTVAYGVAPAGLDRPLTRGDLTMPTPFNTYIIKGLPPTPICNPGAASIRATLNPTKTDFLYFVADGTGGHAFARTLSEHNRNVAKWRRSQRGKSN
ncbi:MAG: endolytic transglycosylase MltG [Alphaproteobacteria bacterium]|nr:endolytic transglycosylase MltG [Alphaproteobacteria bacterium]